MLRNFLKNIVEVYRIQFFYSEINSLNVETIRILYSESLYKIEMIEIYFFNTIMGILYR